MSTKGPSQQARRTPLSLSGGSKQHLQQQSQSNKPSDTNSPNPTNNTQRSEKSANHKPDPVAIEVKDPPPQKESKKSQQKQQQQQQQQQQNIEASKKADKSDEKKTQNGVGKTTNGAAKEKQQNGNQENGSNGAADNVKEKNEKSSKEEKKEKDDKNAAANEKRTEKDVEKKPEKEGLRSRRSDASDSASEKKKPEKIDNMDTSNSNKEDKVATSKPSTPQSKTVTPTKAAEKAGTVTPTKADKANSPRTKTMTTVIDDVEMMEPLAVEASPLKDQTNAPPASAPAAAIIAPPPIATSTPGRAVSGKRAAAAKAEIQIAKQNSSPPAASTDYSSARSYSQISGRRSIRPLSEYTPSKFQNNTHFRESYRRINTELDVTSTTNTSLNVTVGSEIPNSSSFSFFGRGRKRERTPPNSQSAMELQTDAEYSPPKRARLEGFFSVVASPLTMLRSRFSKTSIQSSTPVQLRSKLANDDVGEVQNVSGISVEVTTEEVTTEMTEDITVGKEVEEVVAKEDIAMKGDAKVVGGQDKLENAGDNGENGDEIKVLEAPTVDAGIADTSVKNNKRCNIM